MRTLSTSLVATALLSLACGSSGTAGPQGETGATGPRGPAGPTGAKGPASGSESSDGGTSVLLPPGGRLVANASSCAGAVPVQLADIPSAGVLCYVPYLSAYVPVDGAAREFQTLTLTPTNAGASAIYDVYAVFASGKVELCWDVAPWASTVARADEIAASAFGYYVNAGTIATCENDAAVVATSLAPGAGTYVGSFYTTATSTTQWLLSPDPAMGGTNNFLAVYNAYNRLNVEAVERELASMWPYGNPTGAWREENGSPANRITILDGLGDSEVSVSETMTLSYATGTDAQAGSPGICPDCTTPGPIVGTEAQASFTAPDQGDTVSVGGVWPTDGTSSLGLHYFQAIESGESASSDGPEWYGNYSSALYVVFPD